MSCIVCGATEGLCKGRIKDIVISFCKDCFLRCPGCELAVCSFRDKKAMVVI